MDAAEADRIEWGRQVPLLALHVGCLGVLWVGVSTVALLVAVGLYLLRMFAITAFYHRFFSHRSFRTGRWTQLVFALIANMGCQRGPIWWASWHRHHHSESDGPDDAHSPVQHGFWHSHLGWFMTRGAFRPRWERVGDLVKFRELRWLDRYDWFGPALLFALLFVAGEACAVWWPASGTSGAQLVVWGGFVSTVAVLHATLCVNSLAHRVGSRRFETRDDSRNNWFLALLTLGEGWHNNHHHFPWSTRQGIRWWELDLTWWGLRFLAVLRIVRGLRSVPPESVR